MRCVTALAVAAACGCGPGLDDDHVQAASATDGVETLGTDGFDGAIEQARDWLAVGLVVVCGLDVSGAVFCWGIQGTVDYRVVDLPPAVSVSAGMAHVCVLGEDATPYCWGNNYYGQVGDGSVQTRSSPAPVAGLAGRVVFLSASGFHSCAVDVDGVAWCWGQNEFGQLGDGTTDDRAVPTRVQVGDEPWSSVSAGWECTCGESAQGRTCWGATPCSLSGDSMYLQEDDVTVYEHPTPEQAEDGSLGRASVYVGRLHMCRARAADGVVECWGGNVEGSLGRPRPSFTEMPLEVAGLGGMVVAAGVWGTSCAMDAARNLFCWGMLPSTVEGPNGEWATHVPTLVPWPT
jgi:alpha-tubulin suppressor-like RCC1 family protein